MVLDCTGLACPLPVVKTAQAIKNLAQGQVLELLGIDKQGDVFRILFRRTK